MTSIVYNRVFPVSPERVWQAIGGFNSIAWVGIPEPTSSEGGRLREVAPPPEGDGAVVIERLLEFSEAEMRYTYTLVQGFPVTNHLAELRVFRIEGEPDSAEVQWTTRFTPHGVSEKEIIDLWDQLMPMALESLAKALA
jgi:hypothetical protein